jgi:hypothetical protein
VAVKAKALRDAGGFPGHGFNAEDNDLWLRLGVEPGFVHIASPPVFAYRRHAESAVTSLRKTFDGTRWMIQRERDGIYPGGAVRRRDRLKVITFHSRPLSVACARAGLATEAFDLYRRTFFWNVQLLRMRYLLALPCLALLHRRERTTAAS